MSAPRPPTDAPAPDTWPSVAFDRFEPGRLRSALVDPIAFVPDRAERRWLPTIARLPAVLRGVVVSEMDAGNVVISVQVSQTPQPGSISVWLARAFSPAHAATHQELTHHVLGDPRYWQEDLLQTVDGIGHFVAY